MGEEEYAAQGFIPQENNVNDDSIKWRLDPSDTILDIYHYLKGDMKDSSDEWVKSFATDPLLKDEALNELIGILRSMLNKDIVLSSLEVLTVVVLVLLLI